MAFRLSHERFTLAISEKAVPCVFVTLVGRVSPYRVPPTNDLHLPTTTPLTRVNCHQPQDERLLESQLKNKDESNLADSVRGAVNGPCHGNLRRRFN